MAFERTTVKIQSATPGWELDAWRYLPRPTGQGAVDAKLPVIIMAHGFSANKLMSLSPYAEAFVELGYACIIFDYRRWGASDGSPRHVLVVREQLQDYRTVIDYARQQPEFDAQRVVIWGSSFSGGHAITLASEPAVNPVAVIAQGPYTGGGPPILFNLAFIKTTLLAFADLLKQALGMQPIYIPVAANPGNVGALPVEGSESGFSAITRESKDFPNEVNASSLFQVPFYQPLATASAITCPIILIPTELDNLCPLPGAIAVTKAAKNAELVIVSDGHFDVYPDQPQYEACLGAQLAFLKKHVPI